VKTGWPEYSFFLPKIQKAIAGIAISVALIPPVVMPGLGIAASSWGRPTNTKVDS
jgi:uncharacterized membrane protein